jgi:phosphatidylglycerophosphatase A
MREIEEPARRELLESARAPTRAHAPNRAKTLDPKLGTRNKLIMFCVTGAGAGYVPYAPGTAGTLVGVPLSLALNRLAAYNLPLAVAVLLAAILCAIKVSTVGAALLKQKDPQTIVVDEIVGYMVANFLAPLTWSAAILSFLLFRFFDIVKIFPTKNLEKLSGGAGIVLDDVMAGIYALIIARFLLKLAFG